MRLNHAVAFVLLFLLINITFSNCNRFQTQSDLYTLPFNQTNSDGPPGTDQPSSASSDQQAGPMPTPTALPAPLPNPQNGPVIVNGKVWSNEPSGLTEKVDCPFDNLSACGLLDTYSTSTIQTDTKAPVSPSNVVRSRIEANSDVGGMQLVYALRDTYRELYVGMMWRTNAGFVTNPTAANKMWFMRGPETNGFFGLNLAIGATTGTIGFGHNTGGLDNSHTCDADLGLICNPTAGTSLVSIGQWTKLEAYIKASTTSTSRDGIVRWWVNGVLVGNYTDMNYPGGMNEWIWTETWGNKSVNLPVAREHYLDHLHISARK